ncbi:FHA domain-containing protein [Desulfosporosinus acidiphilus SJ4]|uniref:FHA domain-containing protein n=1 Tax=Desulfosporosinus acidiphilus (strain DSM 22704 / JCM 16185 / SJ4) TaxID=646529 RepID=I4D9U0_DESAJ|nr:FhaA domain-containing protein [Desulfosporosinus acidiphilus]AFM42564.1 FHA domain-containing protein [Desulfosporosinus acidiphilus SJ4]
MSLLARFEGMAEFLFTGAFKKGGARLQPVELAKELVKAMFRHKQISISQVYVPNIYRVYLHSSDWGPLASFGEVFLIELSKYLYSEATREGYTFLSKPAIELHSDDTVQPREMIVEVDFDDSIEVDWEDEEENENEFQKESNWRENTTIFRESVTTNSREADSPGRISDYFLEIIEGPDKGQSFKLGDHDVFIGRHGQCDIVLHDPEVSRRHLKITPGQNGWWLDDLGSTNGSFVNGQRITHQTVAPGDRIQMGLSLLVIQKVPLP